MKNSTNIFDKFDSLKGASFVGIRNYTSKGTGEIANFVLNTNISVLNMKTNDFAKLTALTDADFLAISENTKISVDILKTGFAELVASAEKNLSENFEDRTAASQAQTEAYIEVCKGVKLNKTTRQLYVSGLEQSKTVIEAGTYKTVNSSDKTLGKKAIQKYAGLSCLKFRNYIFENADAMKIKGTVIEL